MIAGASEHTVLPSKVVRFGDAKVPWVGVYVENGKTYRTRGDWTKPGVNVSHSLDDIQRYVDSLSEDGVKMPHDPNDDVPYTTINDFVETMRAACKPNGPF